MLEHGDDAPCPTVGKVWDEHAWPQIQAKELSGGTLDAYRRAWSADVGPRWGDVPCDSVRPLKVQQWLSGLGLSQAKRALQLLAMTLDIAVRYEWAPTNPARERYLMPSKSTVTERDKGVWTLEELCGVWRVVHDVAEWMEPSFILAAFGGCRVGESLGPYAGEVELMEVFGVQLALVPIERQYVKGQGLSTRLKTERSRRTVIVPGRAGVRLAEIAATLPPGCPLTNDGMGGCASRDRVNMTWRRCVLPMLPAEQRHLYQSLRNSWQTNCRWSLGMAPWHIEVLMGHTGKGVTGQHYDRPQVELLAEAVAKAYKAHPYDAGWDI
jgi:hypothetical protein